MKYTIKFSTCYPHSIDQNGVLVGFKESKYQIIFLTLLELRSKFKLAKFLDKYSYENMKLISVNEIDF